MKDDEVAESSKSKKKNKAASSSSLVGKLQQGVDLIDIGTSPWNYEAARKAWHRAIGISLLFLDQTITSENCHLYPLFKVDPQIGYVSDPNSKFYGCICAKTKKDWMSQLWYICFIMLSTSKSLDDDAGYLKARADDAVKLLLTDEGITFEQIIQGVFYLRPGPIASVLTSLLCAAYPLTERPKTSIKASRLQVFNLVYCVVDSTIRDLARLDGDAAKLNESYTIAHLIDRSAPPQSSLSSSTDTPRYMSAAIGDLARDDDPFS